MMKGLTLTEILRLSPIIPVVSISEADEAPNLARALISGGIGILEITLRTDSALDAIRLTAMHEKEAVVGAGSVLSDEDLKRVIDAGAKFAVSPGATPSLLEAAKKMDFPLLPGVATASEIMVGLKYGYDSFKLYPAVHVGGIGALKSYAGPFQSVKFCPTGGIDAKNAKEFLSLENVVCVGGSWISPRRLVDAKEYDKISAIAKASLRSIQTDNNQKK